MEHSWTQWNFGAGKSTSRLKHVQIQKFLTPQSSGPKKLRLQSKDDFMTSQSITGRTDFPDDEMLDTMIASALKKLLNTHVHFHKRVSVEEQRAQKDYRFLRGRQIVHMIYEYFRATGAYEAVQGLSDLLNVRLQHDNVQDFDTRWDQALLGASEIPTEMVFDRFIQVKKCRILFSFRLSWLSTIKKTVRNEGQTSYSRLKIISRTSCWSDSEDAQLQSLERNFRKRSSNQESERGEKPARKERWENAISGNQLDNARKETHVDFRHDPESWT